MFTKSEQNIATYFHGRQYILQPKVFNRICHNLILVIKEVVHKRWI